MIDLLEQGPAHSFADWPIDEVPQAAAGVYTIWDDAQLIYVGMAGRGLGRADITKRERAGKRTGLWPRLASHASGRRSGDQFCVYVFDRLVLPRLTPAQIRRIAGGHLSADQINRDHIREHFSFRFVTTVDGVTAYDLERTAQRGLPITGRPMLNPL